MDMNVITRVLISVADKKGVVDSARKPAAFNARILPTEETAFQTLTGTAVMQDLPDPDSVPRFACTE